MLRIELKAAASGHPGYGELTVRGWPDTADGVELSVQRNQDGRYLGADGAWGTSPAWHAIDGLAPGAEALVGEVGPWLIDPLMLDPQMAYMLQLRTPEHSDKGVLRLLGDILSSRAAGNSLREDAKIARAPTAPPVAVPPPVAVTPPAPEPEPVPVPEPPLDLEPEPEPAFDSRLEPQVEAELVTESMYAESEPRPAAPLKKPGKLPWVLALLVLLIAAGAAYWYFGLRSGPDSAAPTAAADSTAGGLCSAASLAANADDLTFIQACLKVKPSSAEVLAVIEAAKQAKRCGVVQRLYAHKAQAGDAAIAFAYAREYDPESHAKGGCIESADAETAVYWYEIAVANDPANQDASQRLEQLRK